MKIGDVVQKSGSVYGYGLEEGVDYAVIAKASSGGWFVQSLKDGSLPMGQKHFAPCGFFDKDVKVVGRYIGYQFKQQEFAIAA